jgi:hypothetical protein
MPEAELPRPGNIIVYDFAVNEQQVKQYQGIMRQQPAIKTTSERERLLGLEVKDALAMELVEGLKGLGFMVERVPRGTRIGDRDLLIDGQLLMIDEGSPFERLVVGFGRGASAVVARVQVYQAPHSRTVLEFMSQSDSGKLPGVAPVLGVGAVTQGGINAGTVVTNATVSGMKTYKSDVARMAAESGEQVVRYLSEFFAKQGWIRPDQVRKARMLD